MVELANVEHRRTGFDEWVTVGAEGRRFLPRWAALGASFFPGEDILLAGCIALAVCYAEAAAKGEFTANGGFGGCKKKRFMST